MKHYGSEHNMKEKSLQQASLFPGLQNDELSIFYSLCATLFKKITRGTGKHNNMTYFSWKKIQWDCLYCFPVAWDIADGTVPHKH
jgi:hypothetical protein